MSSGGIAIIVGLIVSITGLFLWLLWRPYRKPKPAAGAKTAPPVTRSTLLERAQEDVDHIFNDEFREELRNRGRLHFEKVIGENAMFLQQDLRETTTQVNEYMRTEITRTLQQEFKKYQESISDAKQLALSSIEKTVATIEQQRHFLETQLQAQAETQKARLLEHFESEMASIVNHYVLRAIGNQIDLSDQLEYILAELENNKKAIIEDVKSGI
ncbi:TPA: hypothetical protein DIS56_00670 [Candidatus Saccharibacteria bacterium]|nr:MAG: hypothetical protein A3F05_03015 [Candidatus Saccharibacteria bacterium RIFCSPHIGHO2_12_FULL_47_17]HCM51636.1 hypothetical protein [Candidatus Saccharibacteria bacterium]